MTPDIDDTTQLWCKFFLPTDIINSTTLPKGVQGSQIIPFKNHTSLLLPFIFRILPSSLFSDHCKHTHECTFTTYLFPGWSICSK